MTLEEAKKLYNSIVKTHLNQCLAKPITNLKLMGNKYNDSDKIIAYGIEYSIDGWDTWIQHIKNIYNGDISIFPHLSIIYTEEEYKKIPILNQLDKSIIGELKLVDIRSDIPQEWMII